jgi:hypothetical protein
MPRKPSFAHLLEHLVRREDLGGLPFVDVGVDLGLDELLHRALEFADVPGCTT